MTAPAATIRKGRKFDQVLAGAREIFMRDGFEGASVDEIARASGVSKATLYSYFPDKRLLFIEVATCQCAHQADQALHKIDRAQPPRTVLTQIAESFLGFILSDLGQKIFRVCVAEADRFPELGRAFYNSGPAMVQCAITDYIRAAAERGELCVSDCPMAAAQFAELCKADLWPKIVFGICTHVSEDEKARVIDNAVETFMARYGV